MIKKQIYGPESHLLLQLLLLLLLLLLFYPAMLHLTFNSFVPPFQTSFFTCLGEICFSSYPILSLLEQILYSFSKFSFLQSMLWRILRKFLLFFPIFQYRRQTIRSQVLCSLQQHRSITICFYHIPKMVAISFKTPLIWQYCSWLCLLPFCHFFFSSENSEIPLKMMLFLTDVFIVPLDVTYLRMMFVALFMKYIGV